MTTLVEELEQAAEVLETSAQLAASRKIAAVGMGAFAARLRQRVAWVRELEREAKENQHNPLFRREAVATLALTGPIPSETAPEASVMCEQCNGGGVVGFGAGSACTVCKGVGVVAPPKETTT